LRRLLIRPGAIGDVILSLPELEAARADYTEVWAPRPVLPLIRFADRTRAIADTGLDLIGVDEAARVPALESFDSIYSWYGTNRPEFRAAVAGLPFTFFPAFPIPRLGDPRIRVPDAPIQDFAAIHPFSGSPRKNWPLDHFRAVAEKLPCAVKWIAGPEDTLPDAVRYDDLYDLACWLATSRLYIGNDSGITHLAAAAGVPVIAIFLTTDPAVWAPRGPRVIALRDPSVDQVLDAARLLIR
jgi:heptosyltransferase-3